MAKRGTGKARRVGQTAYHLYVPAEIASDSTFPWSSRTERTRVEVLPGKGVLIARADVPKSELQQLLEEVLK